MKKIHLDQCASTQDFLLEKLRAGEGFDLVSTDFQSEGKGRHQNIWHQLENTLCFSFITTPNEVITLTSLEMTILIVNFFQIKLGASLKLKWPNDLLNQAGQKCGGILINNTNHKCVVGAGLNLFSNSEDTKVESEYPIGFIFDNPFEFQRSELALEIFDFILKNRLSPSEVIKQWEDHCLHQNKNVVVTEGDFQICGKFLGLGKNGEALIEKGLDIQKIYNGNLRIKD